jgi:gliding motility-associated lipoprotein GldH
MVNTSHLRHCWFPISIPLLRKICNYISPIRKLVEFCDTVGIDKKSIRTTSFRTLGMNHLSREKMRLFALVNLVVCSCLFSCQDHSFPVRIRSLVNQRWAQDQFLEFAFKTHSPDEQVDLLYQVQYGPDYSFENIWLKYWLIGPKNDTLIISKDNLFLFEPGSGKPIGTGTGNRIFLDAYFLKNVRLKDPGLYKIKLRHYMRKDSLYGIQAMGVKVKNSD